MSSPIKTVSVVGPTASGKSALGISIAQELNGEVVNVDSVQVYRGLDIGSAKVPESERAGIAHHALDIRDPNDLMNVGSFREYAMGVLAEMKDREKLPVLVGGSSMYLTILLHGIAELPETPMNVREAVASMGREEQHAELTRVDPVTAARLHSNDTQRVSRALEIYRITGRAPSAIFEEHKFSSQEVVSLIVVLCREREDLYRRINERSEQMVQEGLVAETEQIIARYGVLPILDTLGYKQAREVIQGRLAPEKLVEEIALHTRRFAKRQMTYLRNEPGKRGWVVRPTADEEACEIVGFDSGSPRAREKVKGFRAYSFSNDELISQIKLRMAEPLQATEVWYVYLKVGVV
jgi:tRNA dimethylallyltransferase